MTHTPEQADIVTLDASAPTQDVAEILRHVNLLLKKQRMVEDMVSRQEEAHEHGAERRQLVQALVARQHEVELSQYLSRQHPADIAFLLENLPLDDRQTVWSLIKPDQQGAVLLEASDAVRESLISDMKRQEILEAAEHLDITDIAELMPDLPHDVGYELLASLEARERAAVQSVMLFPDDSVGALMDLDVFRIQHDLTLARTLDVIRAHGSLPGDHGQIIVIDSLGKLAGILPITELLLRDPATLVSDVMKTDITFFYTRDKARDAASAFERYDLVCAPVVNAHHQLVGQIPVDAVVDYLTETSQKEMLSQVGLREDEDIFAPVLTSSRNRWAWLALNLVTAFIASRVIGAFEGTIEKLVALAALMPIVASIGGNTGNQTIALMIRGLALGQIHDHSIRRVLLKECGIALVNGLIWGSIMGFFALLFYSQWGLALVMMLAMVLNLMVAALAGVMIPLVLRRFGRDPVMGSSVLLTAITDSMGFFIFLGLAATLLV